MKAFFLQRMCVLYLLLVVLIKVVIIISLNFFFQRMAVVVNLLLVSLIKLFLPENGSGVVSHAGLSHRLQQWPGGLLCLPRGCLPS